MLGTEPFSYNLLRKYQAAFGTLFNGLKVTRTDENQRTEVIKVPLSYARKEKILARLEGDPNLGEENKQAALVLPRMSFEMTTMSYDVDRKLRSTRNHSVVEDRDTGTFKRVLNPVPYDLHFNLYVYVKYQHDGNQIIEQIMPYFTPQFPMKIELIPEMKITVDAPVVRSGDPSCEDTYDGQYAERRAIIWTIPFVMKAFLFGPTRVSPIIKFANVNMYDSTVFDDIYAAVGNSQPIDRVTAQPGLDANGHPTKDITVTLPYQQINAGDDWEYIVQVAGNLDPSEGTGGE